MKYAVPAGFNHFGNIPVPLRTCMGEACSFLPWLWELLAVSPWDSALQHGTPACSTPVWNTAPFCPFPSLLLSPCGLGRKGCHTAADTLGAESHLQGGPPECLHGVLLLGLVHVPNCRHLMLVETVGCGSPLGTPDSVSE